MTIITEEGEERKKKKKKQKTPVESRIKEIE